MGILVEQPQTIVQSSEYKFSSVVIRNIPMKGLVASVKFDVLDQNGVKISEKSIIYSGEEYNAFWADFNSGKYLYIQLAEKENLNVNPGDELESDFINS